MTDMTLTDAERWELACWDERVKNAQIVLGIMEGERANAQARIAAAHADDETPAAPDRAQE